MLGYIVVFGIKGFVRYILGGVVYFWDVKVVLFLLKGLFCIFNIFRLICGVFLMNLEFRFGF